MDTAKSPMLGKTLLIVEDDILPAMVLKDELEDAGYQVMDLTGRYHEAMAAALEGKPDLALVNIELHGRDDGIGLAHELKAMGIPVLFISGQANRARSARSVAMASLPKPYRAEDMVLAVHYLLASLKGDTSLPRPARLEVFDTLPGGIEPKAA
jgi:1,2-diacylglycerol 3-beta-glucosyltransferase